MNREANRFGVKSRAAVRSAFLLTVCLLVAFVAVMGLVWSRPATVSAWVLGNDFYLGVYADPSYGGTVTVPPPDDPDLGTWSYIHSYTLTATPAAGWVLSGWAGCPANWVNGNTVVVNPDLDANSKAYMLNAQGSVVIYAYFTRSSVPITCLPVDGVVWANGGGLKGVAVNEALNIAVSLTTAKAVLYEFGGWMGSHNVIHAIDDYMNDQGVPGTYRASPCYVTPEYDWAEESYSWVKPALRLKSLATENSTITFVDSVPDGHFHFENPVTVPAGTSVLQEWESDNTMVVFDHWDLDNLGCTNIESYHTSFWSLAAGPGTATVVTAEADFTTYYNVTLEAVGSGDTLPTLGDHTYLKGSGITLLAMPAKGWHFERWDGLNNGAQSTAVQVDQTVSVDNATYIAVFSKGAVIPGEDDPHEPAVTGVWGKIQSSLDTVGLNNQMGRMFVIIVAMVAGFWAVRNSGAMRVVVPLGIMAVAIVGGWLPIWIVVLLALGAGVWVFGKVSKITEGGG